MLYLIIVTIVWSFSFSFIGIYLSGQVDTWFAVVMRVLLAFVTFIPFFRIKNILPKQMVSLMGVGACQLGIMYFFYYNSFQYISVPEVLLFTITTPIYVTIIYDLLQRHRLRLSYLLTAVIAVIGAAIIRYDHISSQFIIGFLLIQGANIVFALGQVGYKRIMELYPLPQHHAFAWVYLGAIIVASIGWLIFGNSSKLPTSSIQWWIIVWLGVVASGLCYFLWNYGATKVDSGTLAIMNNVVIPTGILVNVVIWHQSIDWGRFSLGSVVIVFALILHHKFKKLEAN
ncbi:MULTISPECIES: carboxylate/amino acid/amine transporter [unclassified Gilliamella]|uniref:carboxylate/amino acid/amine transporter n=1 Tax=unclassified Gilliamella TaxID=2685620 RepID=UPI00226A7F17|nr:MULTISPECIES: carboxylate/amino acid/amine transporter [unclassified Gilliamella]MCX8642421.1 DMT family transporter [Gilliamella sp. B3835]MCX8706271.1 DMT family transporter [Gilliamella sp. B3783]MCX8709589.1 DMT family transporter [Gilliamella sp. B3780]MCX8712056.1 DMT family transporter [Gilliamella sp. B3468]MCX8714318.1 DMT family transporter [Gilliamella sp. B3781]